MDDHNCEQFFSVPDSLIGEANGFKVQLREVYVTYRNDPKNVAHTSQSGMSSSVFGSPVPYLKEEVLDGNVGAIVTTCRKRSFNSSAQIHASPKLPANSPATAAHFLASC